VQRAVQIVTQSEPSRTKTTLLAKMTAAGGHALRPEWAIFVLGVFDPGIKKVDLALELDSVGLSHQNKPAYFHFSQRHRELMATKNHKCNVTPRSEFNLTVRVRTMTPSLCQQNRNLNSEVHHRNLNSKC
jgi:hypothetical protein